MAKRDPSTAMKAELMYLGDVFNAVFTFYPSKNMGSGLCRRSGRGRPRPAMPSQAKPRATGVADGLYRKMVFNYAKQWTRSDRYHQKNGNTNHKNNNKRSKKRPIISGPFPADLDQLQGEKWRYVILTRLDTEPPPERPPRTRRRRPQRSEITTVGRVWGSVRRRSRGARDNFQRRSGRHAAAATAAAAAVVANNRGRHGISAAELMDLVVQVYRRRPAGLQLPLPAPPAAADHRRDTATERTSVKAFAVKRYASPWLSRWSRETAAAPSRKTAGPLRYGFFQAVGRLSSMTDNLLL
ncbi:Hypothetical protein CINCED_3A012500 [Cinara cedri]|uniref:Uncharacterized protein n=1 Tax=Cinara cedri TaxID=506608 RepID=A0A5E4MBQ8_9HEMI|nr:Hypothetical protein CINCED_3A012500 [Cinara cedri]